MVRSFGVADTTVPRYLDILSAALVVRAVAAKRLGMDLGLDDFSRR